MKERAEELFPFAIAVVLPPAGFVLGLVVAQDERELGTRICVTALLALIVWLFLLLG